MKRVRCRRPLDTWSCTHCGAEPDEAPPKARLGLVCRDCIERGLTGEPFAPLTVAPRKPAKPDHRPILAVSVARGQCLTEDGELFDLTDLPARLAERKPGRPMKAEACPDAPQLPASLVITDNGRDLIGYLDQCPELNASPFWQWRFALRERTSWRDGTPKRREGRGEPAATYCGFASRGRDGQRRATGRSRYFQILDPAHFSEAVERALDPHDLPAMIRFARDVRDFCNDRQLRLATSAAEIAGQLLRDPQFWPRWRRKVPEQTNVKARHALPGNHYQLLHEPETRIASAHKIDLRSAHHHAALALQFPDPDLLMARGAYRGWLPADGEEAGAWRAQLGRRAKRSTHDGPGLYLLVLGVRARLAADPLAPPWARSPGLTYRYIFSNELPELRRRGVSIVAQIASWTSPEIDEGLNHYAWWSIGELARSTAERRAWLKPALLAAYGMLASRPRHHASVFAWGKSTQQLPVYTHEGELMGVEQCTKHPRPNPIANVICRGMIEAHVRLQVLDRASDLREQGAEPLAIFADSIFTRHRPPDAPAWRYEGERTGLKFYDSTHYESQEECKLPGFARSRREAATARLARWQALRESRARRVA